MLTPQSFSPESSRTWFWLFCVGTCGFLAIMFATALGETAVRNLLLASVMGIFFLSGTVLGILVAYQVCQTHLPVSGTEETTAETSPVEVEVPAARGFEGLFAARASLNRR